MEKKISKQMEALELIDINKWTIAELDEYRALRKNFMEKNAQLSNARKEGLETGKLEVATNMLLAGFSVDQIANLTELDNNQIQAIKSKLEPKK